MLKVNIKKKLNKYNLNVNFETGNEVMGLLGMSGSGKSVTLKCLAGIMTPDEGEIILNDRILYSSDKGINLKPRERNIGYLFQDYALFPNMTVGENILVGIKDNKDKNAQVDKILTEMNLLEKKDLYPREISGGEQQRTALARIIVNKPDVLLLDEPFSALDEFNRWKIEFEINKAINKHINSGILVSHSIDEVYRLTSSVCVLHDGKSEYKRSTEDLFKNPKTYASSILSGFKNFSKFEKLEDDRIYTQAWWTDLLVEEVVPSPNGLISFSITNLGLYKFLPTNPQDNLKKVLITDIMNSINYSTIFMKINGNLESEDLILDVEREVATNFKPGDEVYINIPKENIIFLESENYDENKF